MPESDRRDVAVVLSGGGINGVLLELAFLRRLSETALWPRVGWIYGTSAGALARAATRSRTTLSRYDRLVEGEGRQGSGQAVGPHAEVGEQAPARRGRARG